MGVSPRKALALTDITYVVGTAVLKYWLYQFWLFQFWLYQFWQYQFLSGEHYRFGSISAAVLANDIDNARVYPLSTLFQVIFEYIFARISEAEFARAALRVAGQRTAEARHLQSIQIKKG